MSKRHTNIDGQPPLPPDYVQVECLISSGQQWIDTGVPCTESTGGMVDMNLTANAGKPYMLACYNNSVRGYLIGCETPNYAYGFGNVRFVNTGVSFPIGNRHVFMTHFSNGQQTASIDGSVIYRTTLSGTFTTGSINLTLFGLQNTTLGAMQQLCQAKLYESKIWVADNLVRNFVPVVRLQDSKSGLYDIVTRTFFTNRGTGNDFTYE